MKHRAEYPGEKHERWSIAVREAVRAKVRSRGGRKPRLYATAIAPKRAHLWHRAVERSLPKHRALSDHSLPWPAGRVAA